MKRRCQLTVLLVCLAVLTALSGCIKVNLPLTPGSSSGTPSSTTVPQTPATIPSTTPVNPGARPIITTFSASPSAVNIGVASTLTWSVSGADSVSIDHGVGSVALSGSRTVLPAATTVYTLTAANSAGANQAATQIVVSTASPSPSPTPTPTPSYGPPVINYFTATPSTIPTGQYSSLSWSVSNATSAMITPGIGPASLTGHIPVQPSQTMLFTLTATGPGGSTSSAITVTVSDQHQQLTADYSGTWLLTTTRGWEGRMFLQQVGNAVSGTYEYQHGHITGTVSGLTLNATWSEEPTYAPPDDLGSFTVTMMPDGTYWSGTWQYAPSSVHTGGSFEAYRQ
jgi:hypothetical protein